MTSALLPKFTLRPLHSPDARPASTACATLRLIPQNPPRFPATSIRPVCAGEEAIPNPLDVDGRHQEAHGRSPFALGHSDPPPIGVEPAGHRRGVTHLSTILSHVARLTTLFRVMQTSSPISWAGSANWYCPRETRSKKLFNTDWQTSWESNTLRTRDEPSRARASRKMTCPYSRTTVSHASTSPHARVE